MHRGIKLFSAIVTAALALSLASPGSALAKDDWKGHHDRYDHRGDRAGHFDRWDHDRGAHRGWYEHHDRGRHLGWYKHDGDRRYGRDWDHDRGWRHDGWRHGRYEGARYGGGNGACGGIMDRIHNDRSKIAEIGPTGRHRKALQWYHDDLNNAHRDLGNCRG